MAVPLAASSYWELRIALPAETSEALTNFLWEHGALGVIEEADAERRACLRAFYPVSVEPAALTARVAVYREALAALGLGVPGMPEVVSVPDEAWAEAWRAHFRPLAVGRRLLLTPPWEQPRDGGRHVVVIEPGRAFGTGRHPTTQGCLEALETLAEREAPEGAIDLGTGSGILAAAAVALGVAHVLAIDSDPDAVAAAEVTAVRNGARDRIRCLVADARTLETPPAPLVMANLLTSTHLGLADRYAGLVASGGTLVLGGVLPGEDETVMAAVTARGFTVLETRTLEEWTTLVFRATPQPAVRAPDATLHDQQ